jgi:hypothetical protein
MKILIKAIAGSHLFGTNTPSSDQDFKGVFIPDADDILLGKFDQTIHQSTNKEVGQKNTKDDVDVEFYSLDKFLKMLYQGQTVAWELLFTPDHMILEMDPAWNEVRAYAPFLVNKKVDAFIGYCKQQAHKYGVRGSRLNTIETVLKLFEKCNERTTLGCHEHEISEILKLEHAEMIKDKNGKNLLTICGKKFGLDTRLEYVIEPLQKYYAEYGDRSRKAKENQGIDWKALSHAVRVCMQAISLLETGKIELPMSYERIKLLKAIKAGELSFEQVANYIEEYQDLMLEAREKSTLPAEPNLDMFQEIQKLHYKRAINAKE